VTRGRKDDFERLAHCGVVVYDENARRVHRASP
jgi:hypothetical protein